MFNCSFFTSFSAICSLARPWEALVIGAIGSLLACPGCSLLEKLQVDDPVGCVPIHGFAGAWGLLSVSLFAELDILEKRFSSEFGILKGGPWRFLGVQVLLILAVALWAATTTFLELLLIDKLLGLRMSVEEELLGADKTEHGIDESWDSHSTNQVSGNNKRCEEEGQQPVEILALSPIQANQNDCNSHGKKHRPKNMWRIVRIFRPKLQRSVSLKDTQNGVISNSGFELNGSSFVNGTISAEELSQTDRESARADRSAVVTESPDNLSSS